MYVVLLIIHSYIGFLTIEGQWETKYKRYNTEQPWSTHILEVESYKLAIAI